MNDSNFLDVAQNQFRENLSPQDAKAQRKGSSYFSELGVLCVFARVIFFRFGNSKRRQISNIFS
jgi:hypothetical protein